jgi:hypothetical protein
MTQPQNVARLFPSRGFSSGLLLKIRWLVAVGVAVVGIWICLPFRNNCCPHSTPHRSAAQLGLRPALEENEKPLRPNSPTPSSHRPQRSKNRQRTNMKDNGRRHMTTSAAVMDMGMDMGTNGPVAVVSQADYSSFKLATLREAPSMMIRQPQRPNNERTPLVHSSSLSDNTVTESERSSNEHHTATLGNQASKTILLVRILVLSVMASSTAIVAATVFAVMKHAERETFEQSFNSSSASLVSSVGRSLYTTIGAVDTFVVGMVTFARHTQMEWPFVTLPDYAVQLAKIRARSNLACVNQFTLIPANQRQEWESYAFHHDDWVEEGLRVQRNDVNYHGPIISSAMSKVKSYSISGSNGPYPNQTKPYLVSWQSSPVMPMGHPYNVEFSTVYSNPDYRKEAIDHKKVILAEVYNVPAATTTPTPVDDATTIASVSGAELDDVSKSILEFIQYLDPNRNPSEPMSDIIYPILRDAPDAVTADSTTNSSAVGFLIATLFWTDLIRNVLPTGTNGIIFVMENECDQVFSYQIDGPEVTYLGPGDHHNPAYDHLKHEANFVDLAKSMDVTSSVIYTGLSFSDKGCPFHLRLYPSQDFESMFMSNDPFLYTVNVLILFGFVSCLFCAWDSCVERRQKIVMQTVLESSANVFSLEQRVQERTRRIQETNKRLEEANRRLEAASAAQLQTFASMSHEIRTYVNLFICVRLINDCTNLESSWE